MKQAKILLILSLFLFSGLAFAEQDIWFGGCTPMNNAYQNVSTIAVYVYSNESISAAYVEWRNTTGPGVNYTLNSYNTTYAFKNLLRSDLEEGYYTYKAWVNSLLTGIMQEGPTRNITIDKTTPTITVQLPENNSVYGHWVSIPISYAVSDDNFVDECWWKHGSGAYYTGYYTMYELGNCVNATFDAPSPYEGNFIIAIFVNDTANNTVFLDVSYSVDLSQPSLTIESPQNTTYNQSNISLSFTVSDNTAVDTCWWTNATGSNHTQIWCWNSSMLLTDGYYGIKLSVNDTLGKERWAQVNFTVNLNASVTTSTTTSTTSSTTTVNATTSTAATTTISGGSSPSTSSTLSSTSSSTTSITTTIVPITSIYVTTTSVPERRPDPVNETISVPILIKYDTSAIPVQNTETAMRQVKIVTKETVQNVQVEVVRLPEKPPDIIESAGNKVYEYMEIELENVTDEDIDNATIEFRVEKSWIELHDINQSTVVLNRYVNGSWVELNTTMGNEDAEFIYYEAQSPGFSVFAVTGETLGCTFGEKRCQDQSLEQCAGEYWIFIDYCSFGCNETSLLCNSLEITETDLRYIAGIFAVIGIIIISFIIIRRRNEPTVI